METINKIVLEDCDTPNLIRLTLNGEVLFAVPNVKRLENSYLITHIIHAYDMNDRIVAGIYLERFPELEISESLQKRMKEWKR